MNRLVTSVSAIYHRAKLLLSLEWHRIGGLFFSFRKDWTEQLSFELFENFELELMKQIKKTNTLNNNSKNINMQYAIALKRLSMFGFHNERLKIHSMNRWYEEKAFQKQKIREGKAVNNNNNDWNLINIHISSINQTQSIREDITYRTVFKAWILSQ